MSRLLARENSDWQVSFKQGARVYRLIAYFAALDQVARTLVAQWPGPTCILDTTGTPPLDLLARILAEFGLPVVPLADLGGSTSITAYVGTYERTKEGPALGNPGDR